MTDAFPYVDKARLVRAVQGALIDLVNLYNRPDTPQVVRLELNGVLASLSVAAGGECHGISVDEPSSGVALDRRHETPNTFDKVEVPDSLPESMEFAACDHYREVCIHGTVAKQCGCVGVTKATSTVPCPPGCPHEFEQYVVCDEHMPKGANAEAARRRARFRWVAWWVIVAAALCYYIATTRGHL